MGCTSSKKKPANESDDNEIWKKREDVQKESGKKKKKKKKEKKNENSGNVDVVRDHSANHRLPQANITGIAPNAPSVLYATPLRRNKDAHTYTGFKMADESSSSGQSNTPTATPTTRRAHPVFKVATPPPPRRALPWEPGYRPALSSPQAENVSPPSPPPRKQTFVPKQLLLTKEAEAPELPPRKNRECSKISSPSLSRRTNPCVITKLPSPVIMRQQDETPKSSPSISRKLDKPVQSPPVSNSDVSPHGEPAILVTTSPVLMRKTGRIEYINTASPLTRRKISESKPQANLGTDIPPPVSKPSPILVRKIQAELKDSPKPTKRAYDRAPTPPPRLTRSDSKPETKQDELDQKQVGSPNMRRAYPVFNVVTPPPSSKGLINTTDNNRNEGNFDRDFAKQTSIERKKRADTAAVKFRECDPMMSDINTDRVVKREVKTLSMEIEEENLRNLMKEMSAKAPVTSVVTMNVLPGPVLVKNSIIPPPERAVISEAPPPSPSSMDILEEEEDDVEEEDINRRLSKEVEEFGGNVCQRLSMLLESKDVICEQNPLLGSETSNICAIEKDKLENKQQHKYSVLEEDKDGLSFPDSGRKLTTPGGENIATPLDVTNNNFATVDPLSEIAMDIHYDDQESNVSSDMNRKLVAFDYRNYAHEMQPRKRSFPQFEVPKEFRDSYVPDNDSADYPVKEERIVPKEIKRKSLIENLQPLRGSDILCEIITAYAEPDEEEKEEVNEPLVSKETVKLSKEIPDQDKQPSRLDQSLQKIFKMPKMDETYNELLPLENFLEDVLDASPDADNYYPTFDSREVLFMKRYPHLSGRQSMTRTESDIDISEPRDDMSTGSMLADDEDDFDFGSGEIVFSKAYPDTRQEGEVIKSVPRRGRGQPESDYDDNFWEEDDYEEEIEGYSDEKSEELSSEEDEYEVERYGNTRRKHFDDRDRIKDDDEISSDDVVSDDAYPSNARIAVDRRMHDVGDFDSKIRSHSQEPEEEQLVPDLEAAYMLPEPEIRPSCDPKLNSSSRDVINFDFLSCTSHSKPDAGDIAYDSARRQMHEIHEHLQNLRDQMEHLAPRM